MPFGIDMEDRPYNVPALLVIFGGSSEMVYCTIIKLFGPACEGLRTAVLMFVKGPKGWQETSPNL